MRNRDHEPSSLLSLLVLVALLISVTGLWISIEGNQITGFGTATGVANVTVNETTSLTCQTTACNVYMGSLVTGETNNTLNDPSTLGGPPGFNLTNDGNVVVNVTIAKAANLFTQGDASAFQYNFTCLEEVYCANATANTNTNTSFWHDVLTTELQALSMLNFTDGS